MPATANIQLKITGKQSSALDFESAVSNLALDLSKAFSSGAGADKIGQIFSDQRSLAAAGSEDLDLSGVLTDGLGGSVAFTKVKALIIRSAAANTTDVVVGGATSNGFIDFFGASTHKVAIKPGGVFVITAPDANGLVVTGGTADLLKIADGGSAGVTYDIVVLGE